jgi:protein-disulfide isomerase
MDEKLKIATLGGLIGAAVALAAAIGASALNLVPAIGDARIHAYLMAHPAVVFEMAAKAQLAEADKALAERQKAVDKLGVKAFFDPAVAFVAGPANAKNTVVEFFDYNCIHCRNSMPAVLKYYRAHRNDTRFAFIELPVLGEASADAARTALAARAQGDPYLKLHFLLMGETRAIDGSLLLEDARKAGLDIGKLTAGLSAPAVDKALISARKLADEAGIEGTPFFIVNGRVHESEIADADFKRLTK